MPIRVKCENCKKTLSVKEHLAGKRIKCPVCQHVVTIPTASPTKETVPAKRSTTDPPPKAPTPTAKPAPGRPVAKTKPNEEKPESTSGPTTPPPKGNGTPALSQQAEMPPPENPEDEALSVWADEPPPPEETEAPKEIEFKCQWCDEQVKLPIEFAGKQAQCPNEECRRIVKVPLPKVAEKKDWRKMEKKGPVLAKLNQPEQLENAWGTEEATKARQASLVEAGVVELPKKTRPRDIFDWIGLGFRAVLLLCGVAILGVGGWFLFSAKQQQNEIKEAVQLVKGAKAKIKAPPLLVAEAHRTIGMLYLNSPEKNPAFHATNYFSGASGAKFTTSPKYPALNEQLYLIDVALSQIELGGNEAESLGGAKIEWPKLPEILEATVSKIETPEAQILALREIGSRLFDKGQPELAIGLTSKFSVASGKGAKPPAYRQQLAMILARGEAESVKRLQKDEPTTDLKSVNRRVGYAEGFARKGDLAEAQKFIDAPGQAKDRLDASLGVAAVLLLDEKNKDKASPFLQKAMEIASETGTIPTDWQLLHLVKMIARTESGEKAKELAKRLRHPAFQLRAEYEIFLAACASAKGSVPADRLGEIENLDKAPAGKQDPNAGTTLGLAWTALARHNARHGFSRSANRGMFDDRIATVPLPLDADTLRAMVDVGTLQGTMK